LDVPEPPIIDSNLKVEALLSSPLTRRNLLTASLPLLLVAKTSWSTVDSSPARIGWLKIQGPRHTPDQLNAFRDGMHKLGLVEGRDYVIEERYADGYEARLPGLATELLGTGVLVIVATSQPSIAAAARGTTSVPVIGRMNDDPVANGMAESLARPGGNITGIYAMTEELNAKRLALLKEAAPSVRRGGAYCCDMIGRIRNTIGRLHLRPRAHSTSTFLPSRPAPRMSSSRHSGRHRRTMWADS